MRIGSFEVSLAVLSRLRLDGGAVFGTVPKVVWSRDEPADDQNRIELVARALHLRSGSHSVLVDSGAGAKYDERDLERFGISEVPLAELPFRWSELTHIVLTHLHFDHAGGASHRARASSGEGDDNVLRAPQARVVVQRANWERAHDPGPRERASYLQQDLAPLGNARLVLLDGDQEVIPGLRVRRSDGHTRGLQWLVAGEGPEGVAFPSDLVPTAKHLHLPFVMGYDMWVERLLAEKETFLRQAVQEGWTVIFAHDKDIPAARLRLDRRGRFAVGETVEL